MPDTHAQEMPPVYVVARRRAATWTPAVGVGETDPFAAWRATPVPAIPPATGKAIIICCDGTGNYPNQVENDLPAATNVYLLYDALTDDAQFGTQQITWYDPGVGTGTSRVAMQAGIATRILRWVISALPDTLTQYTDKILRLFECATGASIEENIEQGYREIARHYEPGDRIFIFGFSRGAYTARCIAGVIERCGLLKTENLRFSADVITLFRRRRSDAEIPLVHSELIHPPKEVRVHVLGLWDTVASLGLPLWGWWFRIGEFWRNESLDSNPAAICEYVYHALSMDERRSQFFPTVATPAPVDEAEQSQHRTKNIRQIWLRGAHADVGGGYSNRALGDIALEWMLQIARHHGLKVRDDLDHIEFHPNLRIPICPKADPLGKMHDETKTNPGWNIFGAWPRWAPIYRPYWTDTFQRACTGQFGAPHELVYRRAEQASLLWQRRSAAGHRPPRIDLHMARDGIKFLNVGEVVGVRVAADQVWNRTAVAFESAAIYRITYISGQWRDAEKPLCRPAGQAPYGLDLARRLLYGRRRLVPSRWLELLGHVAHPRPWPVFEFGFFALFKTLFIRDPRPLTRSLIPLGKHMMADPILKNRGANSVYVLNLANNGLFYAFANDAWPTYHGNSGAIDLEIAREDSIPPGAILYTLTPRGDVVPPQESPTELLQILKLVEERSRKLRDRQPEWPQAGHAMEPINAADLPADAADAAFDFPNDAIAFVDADEHAAASKQQTYDVSVGISEIDAGIARLLADLREPISVTSLLQTVRLAASKIVSALRTRNIHDLKFVANLFHRRDVRWRRRWQADWDRSET